MFPLLLSSSLLQLGTTEDWEAMVAENTVRIFAFKSSNILQIQTLTICTIQIQIFVILAELAVLWKLVQKMELKDKVLSQPLICRKLSTKEKSSHNRS